MGKRRAGSAVGHLRIIEDDMLGEMPLHLTGPERAAIIALCDIAKQLMPNSQQAAADVKAAMGFIAKSDTIKKMSGPR